MYLSFFIIRQLYIINQRCPNDFIADLFNFLVILSGGNSLIVSWFSGYLYYT